MWILPNGDLSIVRKVTNGLSWFAKVTVLDMEI